MKRRNKYERKMMMNLHLITFLCLVASVLNIALPVMERSGLSIFMLSQLGAIGGIYAFGWISARNAQTIPITVTFILRGLQAVIFIFWRNDLSWAAFGVLVFLDILLMIVLAIDKSNYKYTVVTREDDEFFDK